jgi:beta-galactosidase
VFGSAQSGLLWSEDISTEGAEVLGRFTDGGLAGRPALTRHAFGGGAAWYLGTRLSEAGMRQVMDRVVGDSGAVPVVAGLPDGVQAVRRGERIFLLNHNADRVVVEFGGAEVEIRGFGMANFAG